MTPEQNKQIAEAIPNLSLDLSGLYVIDKNNNWELWDPSADAEQCLMVLKWLNSQVDSISIDSTNAWHITVYQEDSFFQIWADDFKVAVCLAVIEHLNNK